MPKKKLYRMQENRMIAGVCAGFAEFFSFDVVLIRVIWVILAFTGVGVIAYLAALFIMPLAPEEYQLENQKKTMDIEHKKKLGYVLIAFGIVLFLFQLNVFDYLFRYHISWKLIWGLVLVTAGLLLLFRKNSEHGNKKSNAAFDHNMGRPREERMIFGVCAGMAEWLKIDVSLVRILWVLATFASHGIGLVVYFIFVFIFPSQDNLEESTKSH